MIYSLAMSTTKNMAVSLWSELCNGSERADWHKFYFYKQRSLRKHSNLFQLTKSNSNPLSSTENLGVSKRNSYLLAQESPIMVSSVSQSQSQSPRDWSGVPAFTVHM